MLKNFMRVTALTSLILLGSDACATEFVARSKVDAALMSILESEDRAARPGMTEQQLDRAYDLLSETLREMNRQGGLAAVGRRAPGPRRE